MSGILNRINVSDVTGLQTALDGKVSTTGNETVSGNKTLSGQLELTGQSATNGTSAMTRDLGDARYAQTKLGAATAVQDVTNSSTFTDSTYLTVPLTVGTWFIETREIVGSSAFATAGAKSQMVFTGTGTFSGTKTRAGVANAEPVNVAPTWGGSSETLESATFAATQSSFVERRGTIVVTVAGTLKVQFAQNTAVASNYARMHIGSYLVAIRTN